MDQEEEKKRLQALVKEFAKEAVSGFPVTLVDESTGEVCASGELYVEEGWDRQQTRLVSLSMESRVCCLQYRWGISKRQRGRKRRRKISRFP